MKKHSGVPLLILLMYCLASISTASAKVADAQEECVDRMTWSYDEERAVARFKIDLPSCWRSSDGYKVKAWIERNDPALSRPQRAVKKRSCNPTKICRVRVRMTHPAVEALSYRASIEYMATPDGAQTSHRVLTCVSGPLATRCDQL